MKKRETLKAVVTEWNPDFPLLSGRREFELVGRYAQTLKALVEAGRKGVTAAEISNWALRLSHYVHILRRTHGLNIETIEERHEGDFPGKHGRYVLHSQVELFESADPESRAA